MQNISSLIGSRIIGFSSFIFISLVLLYKAAPSSRKRLQVTIFIALCSVAGILAVKFMGGASSGGLVKLLDIAARLLAVIACINVAGVFVFSLLIPKLSSGMSKFLEDVILAGAYIAAGFAVVSASGANLSGILATSAVVTGVVAFSLQDTLGNIIGGMVLHLEDTFKTGDWIGVEKYEGVVREVRWRQTTLETLDGDLVIVPNIILMKSPVTVMGRAANGTRWRAVSFNVYYDSTPGEVESAVNKAFQEDLPAGVAPEPVPYCGLKDFLPNCMAYEVRYYLKDFSSPAGVDSSVRSRIFYALTRAGIKLSVPNRSMVITEAARQASERGAQAEHDRRLDALKAVDVFRPLTAEEMNTLAGRLLPTLFASGETIMKQGTVADWLYVIYEGAAEVRLYSGGSGSYNVVKKLGEGSVLGEMGLFTGEPRAATVVASGEARCYRLDRESFRDVLATRPEIAEFIASMLAKRRVELDAAREKLDDESAVRGLKTEQQNLLSKIKNFFNL